MRKTISDFYVDETEYINTSKSIPNYKKTELLGFINRTKTKNKQFFDKQYSILMNQNPKLRASYIHKTIVPFYEKIRSDLEDAIKQAKKQPQYMKSLNTTIKEANDYLSGKKEDVMNSNTINDAKKTEILKLIDTIKTELEEHINKLKLKLRNMDPNSREQYLSKLPSYYDPVLVKYTAQLEKAIDPDWGTIKSVRNENNAYIQTKRDDVKKLTTISKTKFKDLMDLIMNMKKNLIKE